MKHLSLTWLIQQFGEYLQEHPKLADDFTVEVYGTVGDKCLEVMKGTGVPFKVFQSKLGYSRL